MDQSDLGVPSWAVNKITALYKGEDCLAIEVDEGNSAIWIFSPDYEELTEVSALTGDWRRVWP